MSKVPWDLIGGGVAGLAGSIIGSAQMGKQKREDRRRADKYWKQAKKFEKAQDSQIRDWDPTQGIYNVFGKVKDHDPFMKTLMQRNVDKGVSDTLGMSKYQTGSGNRMALINAANNQRRGGLDQMRQYLGETRSKNQMLRLQGEGDAMQKIAAGKSQKSLMRAQILGERAAGRGSLAGAYEQSAREAAMNQAQIWGDFGTNLMGMTGDFLGGKTGKDKGGDPNNTSNEINNNNETTVNVNGENGENNNELEVGVTGLPMTGKLKLKKLFWGIGDLFRSPLDRGLLQDARQGEYPEYDLKYGNWAELNQQF
jgi:hypothetical protein